MTADPRQQAIWESTRETIEAAASGGHATVLKTYPNGGKTFGFGAAMASLGERGTMLQPNRDLRAETAEQNRDAHGLTNLDYPSFYEDCRYADEDDPGYDPEAVDWRNRGYSPRYIFERKGKPEDDEYCAMMSADWSSFDMHTGDPAHMFLDRAVPGRHVAFDDVDAYGAFVEEHDLHDERVQQEVLEYLRHHGEMLPEEPSLGSVYNPDGDMAVAMASVASEHPSELDIPDTVHVTSETDVIVRALARRGELAVWNETGANGAQVRHMAVRVLHEDEAHVVHMNLPVHLQDAASLTMMTATPVYPVFRRVFEDLGIASQVVDSIPSGMKEDYFDNIIGTTVVQTTEKLNPVSGGNGVDPGTFRVAVEWMIEQHGEKPLIISSKKALEMGEEGVDSDNEPYEARNGTVKEGLADAIEEYGLECVNFSRAIGTNEFGEHELCLIWGCPHFGDGYVKRAAAICGDTDAEPIRWETPEGSPCGKYEAGRKRVETHWSTETAQEIYENMTAGTVLQALMRVGRSSEASATVYCHTSAIPDDVPKWKPKTDGELFHTWSAGEDEVAQAIYDGFRTGDGFTVKDITRRVSVSRTTVWRAFQRLLDFGILAPHGTGDWGAEKFALVLEEALERGGGVADSVSETLDRMLMQKRNDFSYSEPEYDERVGELTSPGGRGPAQLEVSDPSDVQLRFGEPHSPPDRADDDGPPPGEQADLGGWTG